MMEAEMAGLGRIALAVLGILAYKNRDKIGELLNRRPDPANPQQGTSGGLLDRIADGVGAGSGLREVLDRFRNSGSADQVDTWVQQGANQPLEPHQVEAAIDPQTLDELSKQTGLSREELVKRIARDLPAAVDTMTPEGRLPDEAKTEPGEPTLLDDVPMTRQG
jgi:uncharacterized protein YidB (DUF937 family)